MSADNKAVTDMGVGVDKRTPNDMECSDMRNPSKVTYSALFWIFMIGSVIGFVLEGLWCVLKKGHWENHSATVWGPYCIIYGIGAAAVYLLALKFKNKSLTVQFMIFSLSGALVEYFGSLFQEMFFGTISWDYSEHLLNLGGRISLGMTLLWGFLGIAFAKLLFPFMNRLLEITRGKGWRIACVGLSVFMAINLLVSAAAVMRWRTRQEYPAAANAVVRWLDETFDDEMMSRLYSNMTFVGE